MLKKLKSAILGLNIPLLAFVAYTLKVLLISASFEDGLVLAIIAGLVGYKMKMDALKPEKPSQNLQNEVNEIKNALSKVNLASVTKPPRRF